MPLARGFIRQALSGVFVHRLWWLLQIASASANLPFGAAKAPPGATESASKHREKGHLRERDPGEKPRRKKPSPPRKARKPQGRLKKSLTKASLPKGEPPKREES